MPRFLMQLCFILILVNSVFAAKAPSYLIALKAQLNKTHSHFTFIFTQKTVGRIAVFPHPDRVIIELKNAHKKFDIEDLVLRNSNVHAIESETLPDHKLRFIFFVNEKVHARARFRGDHQLVLDIASVSEAAFKNNQQNQIPKQKLITIVIDAGHGGSDPGAKGLYGVTEKQIVLSIAKRLAKKFKRMHNVRVLLTRDQDEFVPLRERLTLARKSKADLFLAIHADSYFNKHAQGASVYALSARGATSEAARFLALSDNDSELGGVSLKALYDKSPMLRKVLIDLAQTATIKDSLRLGESLLRALDDVSDLHHKRVEQAPFLVLKSPDIPSILVETGFISNRREELRLINPYYQEKIAQALFCGVIRYLKLGGV